MVAETPRQLRSLERKTLIEREAGIETHILGANEVREMAPYLSPAVVGAEFCPGEGKMNALAALPAIARAAQAAGARLLRGVELEAIERRDPGMTARTNRGPIRCARLVNATGPSAAHVASMVGASVPVGPKVVQSHVSEPVAPMIPHLVYHCQETLTLKQLNAGNLVIAGGWPGRQWGDGTYPWVRRESMEGICGSPAGWCRRLRAFTCCAPGRASTCAPTVVQSSAPYPACPPSTTPSRPTRDGPPGRCARD